MCKRSRSCGAMPTAMLEALDAVDALLGDSTRRRRETRMATGGPRDFVPKSTRRRQHCTLMRPVFPQMNRRKANRQAPLFIRMLRLTGTMTRENRLGSKAGPATKNATCPGFQSRPLLSAPRGDARGLHISAKQVVCLLACSSRPPASLGLRWIQFWRFRTPGWPVV